MTSSKIHIIGTGGLVGSESEQNTAKRQFQAGTRNAAERHTQQDQETNNFTAWYCSWAQNVSDRFITSRNAFVSRFGEPVNNDELRHDKDVA